MLLTILSVVLVAGGLCFAAVCLLRLPRVWRGERLSWVPMDTIKGPRVEHRSFPVFTVWLTVFVLGWALLAAGTTVGAFVMVVATIVLVPLWLLVNAVNRPSFVVPPARRRERGWASRRRTRG